MHRERRRVQPRTFPPTASHPEVAACQESMHQDFAIYDELAGPNLDAARWTPARLPLPTGEHVPLDRNAEVAVADGELRGKIAQFSLSHDTFQAADSPKYPMYSTGEFDLPPDRPATFAVDLAVENIGGEPGDYRQGMGALHLFHLPVPQRVF